jgi:hypothetical protein
MICCSCSLKCARANTGAVAVSATDRHASKLQWSFLRQLTRPNSNSSRSIRWRSWTLRHNTVAGPPM